MLSCCAVKSTEDVEGEGSENVKNIEYVEGEGSENVKNIEDVEEKGSENECARLHSFEIDYTM